jgi:hypothetical protein
MDADGGNFKMLLGENGKDTIAPHFHHSKMVGFSIQHYLIHIRTVTIDNANLLKKIL